MSTFMALLDSHDERLAQVVSEVTDRIRRGESPELKDLQQQHPDLAKELKDIWPALILAEELAQPSPDHEQKTQSVTSPSGALEHPCSGVITDPARQVVPSLPRTFGDYE